MKMRPMINFIWKTIVVCLKDAESMSGLSEASLRWGSLIISPRISHQGLPGKQSLTVIYTLSDQGNLYSQNGSTCLHHPRVYRLLKNTWRLHAPGGYCSVKFWKRIATESPALIISGVIQTSGLYANWWLCLPEHLHFCRKLPSMRTKNIHQEPMTSLTHQTNPESYFWAFWAPFHCTAPLIFWVYRLL